jgi:RNA polymerase sigma-70 factor (ECF subfamily)
MAERNGRSSQFRQEPQRLPLSKWLVWTVATPEAGTQPCGVLMRNEEFKTEPCPQRRPSRFVEFERFDEHYVNRLTAGDPGTERHFVSYFGRLIRFKLRSKVRSPELIDEICQETFLRVLTTLRRKGGLLHPERLGAFVNTVCNNVMMESFRSETHTTPLPQDFDAPDTETDVESVLVTQDRKKMVETILADLPEKQRDLLRMIFLEEKDKSEVCEQLNVNREYLRTLVHRAKSCFKRAASRHASLP